VAGIKDAVNYQGRFVWYELVARDVTAARDFYSRVMGWGVQASLAGMNYTFFTVRNSFVSGVLRLPETAVQPGWLGYVAVDDVDAAAARLQHLGGTVHAPPVDVFGVSRFAIVADPQNAVLGVLKWLKPRATPLGDTTEAGRVGWHELFAPDCDAASAFYSELFGWRKPEDLPPDDPYRRFAVGGETIGGIFAKPPRIPVPQWLYYFNVADIAAAEARVKTAGGEVIEGPLEVQGGIFILRCRDREGVMFALRGPRRRSVGYFQPATPRATPR
jgi:hypothetical protein